MIEQGTALLRAHHIGILQQFSIPLIVGVIGGLVFANIDIHAYENMVDFHIFGDGTKIFVDPKSYKYL